MVPDSLTIDVILGREFLKSHQCTIEMCKTQDVLHFRKHGLTIPLGGRDSNRRFLMSMLFWMLHCRYPLAARWK